MIERLALRSVGDRLGGATVLPSSASFLERWISRLALLTLPGEDYLRALDACVFRDSFKELSTKVGLHVCPSKSSRPSAPA